MRLPIAGLLGALGATLSGPGVGIVHAQTTQAAAPGTQDADEAVPFTTGLWRRDTFLGDAGGLRTQLGNAGISFGLQDINEVWGNASGGRSRGGAYNGLTMFGIGVDTGKAFGWDGGTFNLSALQIRGRSLAGDNLLNLQTNSGINSSRATRLWEVWYQQAFAEGMADIKIGQQSLDQEFMTSAGSSLFLNTMMGWPMFPSANLYAGGPAYPLSSLGVRLRVRPNDNVTLLGGVFQDNPPGGPFDNDSQLRGSTRWGGNFNLRTGALMFAEAQFTINQPSTGDMDRGQGASGLPGTYKLGVWYDSAAFPSQRFDTAGVPLASPSSNGVAKLLRNNWSVYGVADQMVWRPDPEAPRAVGVFARAMGGPGDRNLISFSLNAGVSLKAPLAGRDDDTFGVGIGVARLSGGAIGFDQDVNRYAGRAPIRSTETFLEVTYQFVVAPWWQIQPDFQYVFMPGGGIANPGAPGKRIGNEAIFGLRSTVTF